MNSTKKQRFKSINKVILAKAYGVSSRTLKLWLAPIAKEIGPYVGRSFKPKQVAVIVALLGEPVNLHFISCTKS